MARVEGYYWVRERDEGAPIIAKFYQGEWTFGDGEYFTDEDRLSILQGPLQPPSPEIAASWKQRYDELTKAHKKTTGRNPAGGFAYIQGYYWVITPDYDEPILAQYMEGWGEAAGDKEFATVEILDGPIPVPQITKGYKV
jgi:hypothetical protein